MKRLNEYIIEALVKDGNVKALFGRTPDLMAVQNALLSVCARQVVPVDFSNTEEIKAIYEKFCQNVRLNVDNDIKFDNGKFIALLAQCGLQTATAFKKYIINNSDIIPEYFVPGQFSSKATKETLMTWVKLPARGSMTAEKAKKIIDKYKSENKFAINTDEEAIDAELHKKIYESPRGLVIYDRTCPYRICFFEDFYGPRNKETRHNVNMMAMAAKYELGINYLSCYPMLAQNFADDDTFEIICNRASKYIY